MAEEAPDPFELPLSCEDLERALPLYLDGELSAPERGQVDRHLGGCAACDRKARSGAALRSTVRSVASPQAAPKPLKERIVRSLRRERRRTRVRAGIMVAGFGLVASAAAAALWVNRPNVRRAFAEEAALRHARGLPLEIERTSAEQVEAWFGGKLDHKVAIPRLSNATLSGARLTHVKDRPAAYLRFESSLRNFPKKRVGLFVFDDPSYDLAVSDYPQVEVEETHGYRVAIWRRDSLIYELVSDLGPQQLGGVLDQAAIRPIVP